MKDFDNKEFKQHLKKVIGYIDEITVKLKQALDSYLLVEKEKKQNERKHKRKSR
jgi:asparagine synthetase B (glutamine-hydrolysing)